MNKGSSGLPRVALIAGPTASGKSALALALARAERGTIVNADASQVYRDLRVLTARPTPEEEGEMPHRLYGVRDAGDPCSAAAWAEDARGAIAETLAAGRLPILVGGTGLYLRALIDGLAPLPPIDPAVRAAVRALPAAEAHAALTREDPDAARRLHPHDTARLHRALEVVRATGRTIAAWRTRAGGIGSTIRLETTIVDPPREQLYAQCDARVRTMAAAGAIEEVAALLARGLDPATPAMRAIGVAEVADLLRGRATLPEAITRWQQATRRYAKRQRTWFRHQRIGAPPSNNDVDRSGQIETFH